MVLLTLIGKDCESFVLSEIITTASESRTIRVIKLICESTRNCRILSDITIKILAAKYSSLLLLSYLGF